MQTVHLPLPESTETGHTGLMHLKRLWAKQQLQKQGNEAGGNSHNEWATDVALMDTVGVGIEQLMVYVYNTAGSFEDFENWIVQLNGGQLNPEKLQRFNSLFTGAQLNDAANDADEIPVLTQTDLDFFDEQGYVIVRNAIPSEQCRAAEKAVWDFLGFDEQDAATWYAPHPAIQGIMVQLFQHEALEANRQSPRIKKAFEQLWGQRNLWVNTDRVSFNPPETKQYQYQGPKMHWDVSLAPPVPFGLQSVLYLTDTAANQGAFTLVPGFHKKADAWVAGLPAGAHPRTQDLHALGSVPVAAHAGDCIIFHHALPHASRPNTARRPRIAQYIIWQPVEREIRDTWI
jgi:hypothetical protein